MINFNLFWKHLEKGKNNKTLTTQLSLAKFQSSAGKLRSRQTNIHDIVYFHTKLQQCVFSLLQ